MTNFAEQNLNAALTGSLWRSWCFHWKMMENTSSSYLTTTVQLDKIWRAN